MKRGGVVAYGLRCSFNFQFFGCIALAFALIACEEELDPNYAAFEGVEVEQDVFSPFLALFEVVDFFLFRGEGVVVFFLGFRVRVGRVRTFGASVYQVFFVC